jgi:hypothetical protein
MNRRTFVTLGLGSLALGSLGLLVGTHKSALRDYVHNVIHEHMHDGGLIAGGIEQFVSDIRNAPHITYQAKGLIFVVHKLAGSPSEILANDFLDNFRVEFNRRIISDYLLSSDFFHENKGPGATVNYLGYTDRRICNQSNPFAKFLDS